MSQLTAAKKGASQWSLDGCAAGVPEPRPVWKKSERRNSGASVSTPSPWHCNGLARMYSVIDRGTGRLFARRALNRGLNLGYHVIFEASSRTFHPSHLFRQAATFLHYSHQNSHCRCLDISFHRQSSSRSSDHCICALCQFLFLPNQLYRAFIDGSCRQMNLHPLYFFRIQVRTNASTSRSHSNRVHQRKSDIFTVV